MTLVPWPVTEAWAIETTGRLPVAGIVFGHDDKARRHRQTDQTAIEQGHAGEVEGGAGRDIFKRRIEAEARQILDDRGERHDRQQAGGDQALVEGVHDVVVLAQADKEGADDRGEDTDAADDQRQQHHHADIGGVIEEDGRQNHGGDRGHRIGFEQIGRHAGAVADIVADIVGDGGRVAGIVFRDTGLDLADHVAADIRAFGEDAAAETGEDGDQRGAEAERHQGIDQVAVMRRLVQHSVRIGIIARHAEQRAAGHEQTGDGAGIEGQLQAAWRGFQTPPAPCEHWPRTEISIPA